MTLTFVNPPRMTKDRFRQVLADAKSPALPEADAMYDTCVRATIDPLVFLGFFKHESQFGNAGINPLFNLKNPGCVRQPFDPKNAIGTVAVPNNGAFAKYATWRLGTEDWCLRILHRYVDQGFDTVEKAIPRYAPSSDGNNEAAYIKAVEDTAAKWQTTEATSMQTTGYADRDDLLPKSTDTHPDGRTGAKLTSFGAMVIHETANESPDATAAMHHNYWMPGGSGALLSSVQFVTDATESIQLIPVDEQAEHAGDVVGNTTGVGIEICVNSRAAFPAACRKAALIVAKVLKAEGKTPQDGVTIRKHGSYPGTTHTHCPQHLNAGDWGVTWSQFIDMVKAAYAAANGTPTPAPAMRFLTATVVSNVRTGPGTQYPIATVMHAGETAGFDSEKVGESIQGNDIWLHRADQKGFVFSGLLVEGT